jgi:hypothetical protein
VRLEPYAIVFTASNTRATADTTAIVVAQAPPNLCGNGAFEAGSAGWGPYGNATLAIVDGGRSGKALSLSGSSSFGADDVPDWLPGPLVKGDVYRIRCWIKRGTTSGSAGNVRIRVYEYLGSSQQGSTAYSQTLPLTTSWQQLLVDYVVRVNGTRLSIRVTDAASSSRETFLVDDVVIEKIGAGAASSGDDPLAGEGERFAASFMPNPTWSRGLLTFTTTREGPARVSLYDVNGRQVRRLLDQPWLEAGVHDVVVETRAGRGRLAPGVYFYSIQAGEGTLRGRVVFLK